MTVTQPVSTPPAPPASVSATLLRKLPGAVLGAVAATAALIAGIIVLANQPAWWPAMAPATVTALLSAVASIAVLRAAPGKSLEKVIGIVYIASGVRFFASAIGCLIAVKIGHHPAKTTGLMICGYYVAVLITESIILARAVASAPQEKSQAGISN